MISRIPIRAAAAATFVLLLLTAAVASAGHPLNVPALRRDGPFPRCEPEVLAENGFPDHQHAYFWPDWHPCLDAQGRPYGFGTICRGARFLDRDDLVSEPGLLVLGNLRLEYNEGYTPCDMAPFLEFCEQALHEARDLLDLASDDTLTIINPDRVDVYKTRTAQGTWRMFKLSDDHCVVQPIPVLLARTLAAHAAYDMCVQWLLDRNGCDAWPRWLREGLAANVAELGVHLNNYMMQFRADGEVRLTPAEAEKLLTAPPIIDDGLDREMFRRARYTAFLMVWELIEHRGGLGAVRRLITATRSGRPLDEAAREIYGLDMAALADELAPLVVGDPLLGADQIRYPHRPPEPPATDDKD